MCKYIPHRHQKNEFISFNIENGQKLNSWLAVLSCHLLRGEWYLLFTFELANQWIGTGCYMLIIIIIIIIVIIIIVSGRSSVQHLLLLFDNNGGFLWCNNSIDDLVIQYQWCKDYLHIFSNWYRLGFLKREL